MMKETAEAFLRRHDMHYAQMPFGELVRRYREDMDAALAGRPSTVLMLPSFLRADEEPRRGENVLVIDAGGSNLRAGRAHFDAEGRPVIDALRKRRMPGAGGEEIDAETMVEEIASFALEFAGDCRRACIGFSYPCDVLPDGDGRILRLGKEVRVRGVEGLLLCAALEKALQRMGAAGERKWKLVNDSVGSLLGGMAEADRRAYADYIGFILGTGTNACCRLPSAEIIKSPEAMALGGETIVNVESGCFGRLLQGTADRELDAASDMPGDHLAEKMISGGYYRQVLRRTLLLAVREGILSPGTGEALEALRLNSAMVDAFCREPRGDNPLAGTLANNEERDFAAEVNTLLLERAARVSAACLAAIAQKRALPAGSRVCVCADGTMLRLNPVLLPRMEAILRENCPGVEMEFRFIEDATLLGCVWAGLTGE